MVLEKKESHAPPEECMRNFIDFLELEFPHRVECKLGRMTHTSRGMHPYKGHTAVGLRPLSKPRSPVVSHTRRVLHELKQHMGLRLSTEHETKLLPVFQRYCSFGVGESSNYIHMRRGQFLRLVRDCHLPTEEVGMEDISLIFEKVNRDSKSHGDRDQFLTFREFIETLARTSMRLHQGLDVNTAFAFLVDRQVLPRARKQSEKDILAAAVTTPGVLAALKPHRGRLKDIFRYYINVEEQTGATVHWDDIQGRLERVSIREFMQFMLDFLVSPELMHKVDISRAFREAAFSRGRVLRSAFAEARAAEIAEAEANNPWHSQQTPRTPRVPQPAVPQGPGQQAGRGAGSGAAAAGGGLSGGGEVGQSASSGRMAWADTERSGATGGQLSSVAPPRLGNPPGMEATTQLTYPEFEECIARCAMYAYGYAPPTTPRIETGFVPTHPKVTYKPPPPVKKVKLKRGERAKKQAEPPKMGPAADVFAKNLWGYVKDREMVESDVEALSLSGALGNPALMESLGSEQSGLTAMSSPPLYIVRLQRDDWLTHSAAATREFEQQKKYFPHCGMPVIYHDKMEEMVARRRQDEEGWKEQRREFHAGRRLQSRLRNERRTMERQELENRSRQRPLPGATRGGGGSAGSVGFGPLPPAGGSSMMMMGGGPVGGGYYPSAPPRSAPARVTRPLVAECNSLLATNRTIDERLEEMAAADSWPRRHM